MTEIITSSATIINPQLTGVVHDWVLTGLQASLFYLAAKAAWLVNLGIKHLHSGWKQTVAKRLVAFAAQRFEPNEEKRSYVAQKLHDKFPRLTEEEIQHLLEEAVVNLKEGLSQAA